MSATLRRGSRILFALILVAGCGQHPAKPKPWVWPGANPGNTLFFAQAGTKPAQRFRYAKVWDAERYEEPVMEPVPAVAHAWHQPMTADLDHDGHLELIAARLTDPPQPILTWQGVIETGRGRVDWSQFQSDRVRIAAPDADSAVWLNVSESLVTPGAQRIQPILFSLNHQFVAVMIAMEPSPPHFSRVLECRDWSTGVRVWSYAFGPRPELMAVADLDSDGREELLVTTYGEENGVSANGTTDQDSCYCIALRADGTLLWRQGFGAHPFSGCLAGVADLDSDGKPEVFVACYTWQNKSGRVAVLDGKTGLVIAETPGPDSLSVSHVSIGCADVDADGRLELAAAVSGRSAELLLYRLEKSRLSLVARTVLSQSRDTAVTCECRLHGICDLDGDGKCELVVSRCQKRQICPDPVFYPSKYDSCGLVVLGPSLESRQEIPLLERCQDVTLGDVIPGGNIELLVTTDRLTLYSTETD